MSGEYIMAVKSIGLSKVGGRKPCTLEGAAKHNKRELASDLADRGRIDPDRVILNYSITGPVDAAGVLALALQQMAAIDTSPAKMRRDYCQAVEVVFSLPANTTLDTGQYFAACVAWCCDWFEAGNVLSADVHHDESTPHCHVLIAPIQDGSWVGGRLIEREPCKAMRASFSDRVANVYGLRMVDRLTGKRKSDAVALVLNAIEASDKAVIASRLWQPLRQAIEPNPAPFAAAMGLTLGAEVQPKRKTMAQIFTGTGKGPKREAQPQPNLKGIDVKGAAWKPAESNPIGIAARAKPANPKGIEGQEVEREDDTPNPIGIEKGVKKIQSLSCVGIAFPKSRFAATSIARPARAQDTGRTVERDFSQLDHDSDDFSLPPDDDCQPFTDDRPQRYQSGDDDFQEVTAW